MKWNVLTLQLLQPWITHHKGGSLVMDTRQPTRFYWCAWKYGLCLNMPCLVWKCEPWKENHTALTQTQMVQDWPVSYLPGNYFLPSESLANDIWLLFAMRIKLFGNIESARMEAKLNVGTGQATLPLRGKPLWVAHLASSVPSCTCTEKAWFLSWELVCLSWGQPGCRQDMRYCWIRSLKRNSGWAAAHFDLFLGVDDARVLHRVSGLHLSHPELPQFLLNPLHFLIAMRLGVIYRWEQAGTLGSIFGSCRKVLPVFFTLKEHMSMHLSRSNQQNMRQLIKCK